MSQQIVSIAIKPENFSIAFEQMCNFVAISDSVNSAATLEKLIQQCFVLKPGKSFAGPNDFIETTSTLFGIDLSETETRNSLDRLQTSKVVTFDRGRYTFALDRREELKSQIREADKLEKRVRQEWWEEIEAKGIDIDLDTAWAALRAYLTEVFRRHGLQAVALLDTSMQSSTQHEQSVTGLLNKAVEKHSTSGCAGACKAAILSFLQGINTSGDRVSYIAQLADAAYNYFSLVVPPEVTNSFRKRLEPLVLFLDTNFLFGLLDLNVESKIVSDRLISAITESKLPFRLRYHQETDRELRDTIEYQAERLKRRAWPRNLSATAARTRNLPGVELRYHQKNAEAGMDVSSFLEPYEHPDILLKDKGIEIYRTEATRDGEVKKIEYEYQTYLEEVKRPKSVELTRHDAVILSAAHKLRSSATSSLAAGSLLVTFDHMLYRFDQRLSRDRRWSPCTVLPESFLQVIRPYLPSKHDYDEAFAQTFAATEFRTMGSNTAEAASKTLSVMASYARFPEETAAKILSNRPFLEGIRSDETEEEIRQQLEGAIQEDNALLIEEVVRLREEQEASELKDAQQDEELKAKDEELKAKGKEIAEKAESENELSRKLVLSERSQHQKALENNQQLKTYHNLQQQQRKISGDLERARDNKSEIIGEIQTLPAKKIRTTLVWTAITVAVLFALTFPLKSAIPVEWKQFLADALTYVGLGSLTIVVAAFFIINLEC